MNQIKIGKFIADCRKQVNLTQMQLAEKLGITDKAVSKWERGIAMPDTSIMLELCDILHISVNELLCGEKISTGGNALGYDVLQKLFRRYADREDIQKMGKRVGRYC